MYVKIANKGRSIKMKKKKVKQDFEREGKYHFFPMNKKEEEENKIYEKKHNKRYRTKYL